MENALKHSYSKFVLIGKIKGLAQESKKTRARILKAKKEEAVWNLASRKRIVGIDIRHHLLAYAFMRGTAYRAVERSCAKDNLPNAGKIFQIVEAHAPTYWGGTWKPYKPTLNDVHVWLAWPNQEAL